LFVLIIPILMLGAAYIIDNIYIAYHTNKLNEINNLVIKDASINKLSTDEIEEYVKKNDKDIEVEFIMVTSDKLKINLSKQIKSFFGIVIGRDTYTLKSSKTIDIIQDDVPIYQ